MKFSSLEFYPSAVSHCPYSAIETSAFVSLLGKGFLEITGVMVIRNK